MYKSDLEWLRGIGWLPNDSPVVKRVKNAQELLSDNVYRTPIDSVKYTSVVDSPDVVLAKINAEQISIVRSNLLKDASALETKAKEKSHCWNIKLISGGLMLFQTFCSLEMMVQERFMGFYVIDKWNPIVLIILKITLLTAKI